MTIFSDKFHKFVPDKKILTNSKKKEWQIGTWQKNPYSPDKLKKKSDKWQKKSWQIGIYDTFWKKKIIFITYFLCMCWMMLNHNSQIFPNQRLVLIYEWVNELKSNVNASQHLQRDQWQPPPRIEPRPLGHQSATIPLRYALSYDRTVT